MSYCRVSSDDWGSDVYCYANQDGFVVHVAALRFESDSPIPPIPPIHEWDAVPPEELAARFGLRQAWVDSARRVPIGLGFDGETFCVQDALETAELLEMLRAAGYRVPQDAIGALREEAAEVAAGDPVLTQVGEIDKDWIPEEFFELEGDKF